MASLGLGCMLKGLGFDSRCLWLDYTLYETFNAFGVILVEGDRHLLSQVIICWTSGQINTSI